MPSPSSTLSELTFHRFGVAFGQRVVLAEMEAAGLYACALANNGEALTVLTVTDHLLDGSGDLSAEERETQFQGALEAAIAGLLA